jgi:hypothetical protein
MIGGTLSAPTAPYPKVRRHVDAANLDVLVIFQSAKANPIWVVVQIRRKYGLRVLDLSRNFVVVKVVGADPKWKTNGIGIDVCIRSRTPVRGHCND